MNSAPGSEDAHSRIRLQHTSSPTFNVTNPCCVICLGELTDQCEANPCGHDSFDYCCLLTWLQHQPRCPLCKSNVGQVRYDPREDGKYAKLYKVPEQSKRPDVCLNPQPQVPSANTRAQVVENEAILRRRFINRHNLYSLHIGSNKRQSAASRHIELSPQAISTNPELISRARKWLDRELRVFTFLWAEDGSPTQPMRRLIKADYLLEYIIAILKTIDIQGSEGQAENMIQEFLGRENSRLFLHELRAWLRSPCGSLSEWDRVAQYGENATSRVFEEVERSEDRIPNQSESHPPISKTKHSKARRHEPYDRRPGLRRVRAGDKQDLIS